MLTLLPNQTSNHHHHPNSSSHMPDSFCANSVSIHPHPHHHPSEKLSDIFWFPSQADLSFLASLTATFTVHQSTSKTSINSHRRPQLDPLILETAALSGPQFVNPSSFTRSDAAAPSSQWMILTLATRVLLSHHSQTRNHYLHEYFPHSHHHHLKRSKASQVSLLQFHIGLLYPSRKG